MANAYQGRNRGEMRRQVGRNCNCIIVGTAKSTTDTSSLIDTYGLRGGDSEHNGKEVIIYDATGSIVDGEKSRVSAYDSATSDATVSPVFTASITSTDKYEMWDDGYDIDEINALFDQAIIRITDRTFLDKVTETTYTERDRYEYNVLSDFVGVHTVDYVSSIGEEEVVADGLWTGATGVTASQDDELDRGSVCTKLVVSAGVAAAAQLGYFATGTLDLSNYDTIELWIRSDIAQTAANLELLLCSDTLGVTAVDTISLPALTIDTQTRIQLTMANPELDTAIASIALKQKAATDIGACKIWIEYAYALKSASRVFAPLPPEQWTITKATTPLLKLTPSGLSTAGSDTLLRISGYQIATLLTDDTTDADIDPDYLIYAVTGDLLMNHYKGKEDTKGRIERAQWYLAQAKAKELQITITPKPNTRW